VTSSNAIPTPEALLGYRMGTARRLPDWDAMVAYFEALAVASARVEVDHLGESTEGRPYIAVTISSPENLAQRAELRGILERLRDPRGMDEQEETRLVDAGRVTAFLLCTQHSNEVGAAIMTLELAAELAMRDDADAREILDNVVVVIVPTHNPDGHQMIVDWYRRWLGTPYEGQPMPWLYHRYVGHDNNRDWFMLTQAETRLYVALHNREHPQLVFDMHQMQRDGARFMVPPFIDPLDPNQDAVIQQGFADLGTTIATRLTAAGKRGVATNIIFDNWSPSLAYGNYHGSVDLLSEAASCLLATPVTIDEEKLKNERGFDPKARTWNHPLPWKGGEWTLSDIVEYDRLAALAFLEHAARNRRQWLRNYVGINRRAVERDYSLPEPERPPYAWIIPHQQDDAITTWELVDILRTGAVEIEEARSEFVADGVRYPTGSLVVRLGQPAGNFAKTLLEVQRYPDLRKWPAGPPAPPYDIAGHTLPLQMGVRCVEVGRPFEAQLTAASIERPRGSVVGGGTLGWAISPRRNQSFRALNRLLANGVIVQRMLNRSTVGGVSDHEPHFGMPPGVIVVPAQGAAAELLHDLAAELGIEVVGIDEPVDDLGWEITPPRVAVYQSWRPTIDEGWVRWIFEEYELPYSAVHDDEVRQGNLRERFDTVIIPQQKPEDILRGNPERNDYREPYPPQYTGGLGEVGVEALRAFALQGGTLVAIDSACEFVVEHLHLPVKNVVAGLPEEEFYCPGSLLRLVVEPWHPLGYGMPRDAVAVFMKSPAFELLTPDSGTVVGYYPATNPNLSGWILGANRLSGKGALLEVPLGAGRVILIGFRAQFRAQARNTYKVLFNAVLHHGQRSHRLALG
jgi:hypothetical protein